MKHLFTPCRTFTALAVASALLLTTLDAAEENKPSTTVGLQSLKKSLAELQLRITETVEALDSVKQNAKNTSELSKAHASFAQRYAQLEKHIDLVRSQGTLMKIRGAEHYKAWQRELSEMQNPKLREKALNRFEEAKEEFDQIIVIADEAKQQVTPFLADLKDVRTYLNTDLSADAVKSLSNSIWKLGNKARSVNGSIAHINEQIDRALDLLPAAVGATGKATQQQGTAEKK